MESTICKSADEVFVSANKVVSTFERDRVLIDIAFNVGAERLTDKYEIDSRVLVKKMIAWADCFMETHRNTDWDMNDYMLTVDDFTEQNMKKIIKELKQLS